MKSSKLNFIFSGLHTKCVSVCKLALKAPPVRVERRFIDTAVHVGVGVGAGVCVCVGGRGGFATSVP